MRLFWSLLLIVSAQALELRSGDIILLPMKSYVCRLIETSTNTPFCHSGVVILDGNNRPFIAEALGTVRAVSVESFLARADRPPQLFRPRELVGLDVNRQLLDIFIRDFYGAGFDHQYLWDNYDEQGRELFYCSEFITKLLNHLLNEKIPTHPMDYSVNYDFWFNYFHGEVPHDKEGNSPGDFAQLDMLIPLGELVQ